ncbi:MAG: hypothetical protein ACJ76U_03800 [Gaiellaceae bacterium]|jgi:hypothetical protein
MSIVNRRNAVLGWAVWNIVTRVAKSKAKRAVPVGNDGKPGWLRRTAVVGLGFAAATGAALVFWRKKNDDTPPVV